MLQYADQHVSFGWSHHGKIVIVDHYICFVGELDLLFGCLIRMITKLVILLPLVWLEGLSKGSDGVPKVDGNVVHDKLTLMAHMRRCLETLRYVQSITSDKFTWMTYHFVIILFYFILIFNFFYSYFVIIQCDVNWV